MKRSLSITLLSDSLGMPAVGVGAAVICKTHSAAYNKLLAKISRPVKRTHKVSKAQAARFTAYNKAMLAKLDKDLDSMCNISVLDAEPNLGGLLDIPSEAKATPTMEGRTGIANIPTETNTLSELIAMEEYPTYEATQRTPLVDGERGPYTGFPGWFGGGGYLPGGGRGTSVAPPPVIQPTPEPMTLALLGTGLLLGWRLKR